MLISNQMDAAEYPDSAYLFEDIPFQSNGIAKVPDITGYPAMAYFKSTPVLDDVIAQLPGLLGAWDAEDYSGSGNWLPRIGDTAQIIPASGDESPLLVGREGKSLFKIGSMVHAHVAAAPGKTLKPLTGLTYACRAYFSDDTTNLQVVFDLTGHVLCLRPTKAVPNWQFIAFGTGKKTAIRQSVVGWHDILFRKEASEVAWLSESGEDEKSLGTDGGVLNNDIILGNGAKGSSADHEISRIIICNSGDLTAMQRQAILTWINL